MVFLIQQFDLLHIQISFSNWIVGNVLDNHWTDLFSTYYKLHITLFIIFGFLSKILESENILLSCWSAINITGFIWDACHSFYLNSDRRNHDNWNFHNIRRDTFFYFNTVRFLEDLCKQIRNLCGTD